ncbi:MAG TPA: tetratricopeptide repeat protein [Bryobacteraceae bacterium]|nr:tetratricopeptide repeat protein [Bryobacteraceae bacterium]
MFAQSARLSSFLEVVVETALDGRAELNEYAIGVDVFGRGRNFDQRIDPIVRVYAGRLRSKLRDYYENEGAADPLEIYLPARTYTPAFRPRPRPVPAEAANPSWSTSAQASNSVMVVPFTNLSTTKEHEFFATGLTQELIHALTRMKGLRVAVALGTGEREPNIRELGNQFNVQAALQGTVRTTRKQLRVSAELVAVADGTVLWSQIYQSDLYEIIPTQEKIATAICLALRLQIGIGAAPDMRRAPANHEAQQLYLKGLYQCSKKTADDLKQSLEYLSRATVADPTFGSAHAALAEALVLLATHGEHPPRDVMPQARSEARRALECDPMLAGSHVSLGLVAALYDYNPTAAETEFARAFEINPSSASALHWYGAVCLAPAGRLDEAVTFYERARELDPLLRRVVHSLAFALCATGRTDAALEQLRDALDVEPDDPITHWLLGLVYETALQFDKAIEEFERAWSLSSGMAYTRGALAHAYGMAGQTGRAAEIMRELRPRAGRYVPPIDIAIAQLGLRQYDDALSTMEQAYEERCPWLVLLNIDSRLQPIRLAPRYKTLLRNLGLPA